MDTITAPLLDSIHKDGDLQLIANGQWTSANATELETFIDKVLGQLSSVKRIKIDMTSVQEFDTFGAWLLERLQRSVNEKGIVFHISSLPESSARLFREMENVNLQQERAKRRDLGIGSFFESLGKLTHSLWQDLLAFINLFGAITIALMRVIRRPHTFRMTSMVHQLDRVGLQAVPIILLITFLIGAIIAQQGFFHFRRFGAELYVVDMVGILVLREVGILLVAIMIAGRSGSSYTAELGSMKMREEIDALRTMGFDPVEVLVLPRVLVLIIAVPILTFLGSMAALYGGEVVAWAYGGMSNEIFETRLKEAISLTHFQVGMIKAPFMGLIIGVVACTEGLKVKGSSESLGLQTTMSVVKAIFMVIVLDGLFAIFFSSIGM